MRKKNIIFYIKVELFEEWNITTKVISVIHDSTQNMVAAIKYL